MKTFRNGDYVYTIDGLNVVRVGIADLSIQTGAVTLDSQGTLEELVSINLHNDMIAIIGRASLSGDNYLCTGAMPLVPQVAQLGRIADFIFPEITDGYLDEFGVVLMGGDYAYSVIDDEEAPSFLVRYRRDRISPAYFNRWHKSNIAFSERALIGGDIVYGLEYSVRSVNGFMWNFPISLPVITNGLKIEFDVITTDYQFGIVLGGIEIGVLDAGAYRYGLFGNIGLGYAETQTDVTTEEEQQIKILIDYDKNAMFINRYRYDFADPLPAISSIDAIRELFNCYLIGFKITQGNFVISELDFSTPTVFDTRRAGVSDMDVHTFFKLNENAEHRFADGDTIENISDDDRFVSGTREGTPDRPIYFDGTYSYNSDLISAVDLSDFTADVITGFINSANNSLWIRNESTAHDCILNTVYSGGRYRARFNLFFNEEIGVNMIAKLVLTDGVADLMEWDLQPNGGEHEIYFTTDESFSLVVRTAFADINIEDFFLSSTTYTRRTNNSIFHTSQVDIIENAELKYLLTYSDQYGGYRTHITNPLPSLGVCTFEPTEEGSFMETAEIDIFIQYFGGTFQLEDSYFMLGQAVSPAELYNQKQIIKHGRDFKDFQEFSGATTFFHFFFFSNTGDYIYNSTTGNMIEVEAGTGTHIALPIAFTKWGGGEDVQCYFDTVNILIDPLKFSHYFEDTTIEALVDFGVSMARGGVAYTDDTKFAFDESLQSVFELGKEIETGSFGNDTVRYIGYRQVESVKTKLDYRGGHSVKLRIFVRNDGGKYDMFRAFSVSLLSSGRIIEDGDNNA